MKVRRVDFYPDDWIAGTIQLDHFERSVYISICAGIYATGGPVSLEYVRRICPGRGFQRGLAGLLRCGKVSLAGGFLSQSRSLAELKRSSSRIDQARENGAKGGRPNGLAEPPGSPLRARATPTTTINQQPTTTRNAREERKNGSEGRRNGDTIPGHHANYADLEDPTAIAKRLGIARR